MKDNGKVGVQTSVIVNAKKVSRVKCNCNICYHAQKRNGKNYCKYYDLEEPKRKTCARYSKRPSGGSGKRVNNKKAKCIPYSLTAIRKVLRKNWVEIEFINRFCKGCALNKKGFCKRF